MTPLVQLVLSGLLSWAMLGNASGVQLYTVEFPEEFLLCQAHGILVSTQARGTDEMFCIYSLEGELPR